MVGIEVADPWAALPISWDKAQHAHDWNLALNRLMGLVAVALLGSGPLQAANLCREVSIEKSVELLQKAYTGKQLEELDGRAIRGDKVQFIIEHSLGYAVEVAEHKIFALADDWQVEHEVEAGIPVRASRQLKWCRSGLCLFDSEEGPAHNHLYLDKIIYAYQGECPYVRSVILLDGD